MNRQDKNHEEIINELHSLQDRITDFPDKVGRYHDEFNSQLCLSETDIKFMLAGLFIREFLILYFREHKTTRLNDQTSAAKFHKKEKSFRQQKYYASQEEIISNPVPFDAIHRTPNVHEQFRFWKIKISGFDHRFTAIGHDPILGLVFGTANIMTNTITISTGISGWHTYHVGTFLINEEMPQSGSVDKIYERANTLEMLEKIVARIQLDKKEGFTALGTALIKEVVHLLSDVRTEKSLPIPFVSAVSPKVAQVTQLFGFDSLDLVDNTIEYWLARLVDFCILTLRDFYYKNCETPMDEQIHLARMMLIEKYMNEAVVIGESIYGIKTIVNGEYAKAVRGYSFGSVLEAMQKILNDGNRIAEFRHKYVLENSINYIKSL